MATQFGIELLSALRRSGSIALFRDIPEAFFVEDDELNAFRWMRDHVAETRSMPNALLVRRYTGIQTVQTTQPFGFYFEQCRRRALYNFLLNPFGQMRDAVEAQNPDGFVQVARELVQASAQLNSRGNDFVTLEAAMQGVVSDYREAASKFGALKGIPSGWTWVDMQTDGWQNDDLISIVGRIGVGKTYIMLYLAYSAWMAGHSVLFNTNELGINQLARRLFGIHTKINPNLIRRGQLSTVVSNRIEAMASTMVNGIPFNIVSGGFKKSVETIAAVAESLQPDIIFSDASYLLKPITKRRGSEGRRETVSDTVEDLKRLNIELRRPIIQSVQFNRSAERDMPRRNTGTLNPTSHLTIGKIGETDVIGQVSSIVWGIAKAFPPRHDIERWIAFLKGREGESGVFRINYVHSPVNFDFIGIGNTTQQLAVTPPDFSSMV